MERKQRPRRRDAASRCLLSPPTAQRLAPSRGARALRNPGEKTGGEGAGEGARRTPGAGGQGHRPRGRADVHGGRAGQGHYGADHRGRGHGEVGATGAGGRGGEATGMGPQGRARRGGVTGTGPEGRDRRGGVTGGGSPGCPAESTQRRQPQEEGRGLPRGLSCGRAWDRWPLTSRRRLGRDHPAWPLTQAPAQCPPSQWSLSSRLAF